MQQTKLDKFSLHALTEYNLFHSEGHNLCRATLKHAKPFSLTTLSTLTENYQHLCLKKISILHQFSLDKLSDLNQ